MSHTRPVTLLVLCLSILSAGCSDPEAPTESTTEAESEHTSPDWSYEGDTGPEHWADLSSRFASCDGSQQSPIDLTDASAPNNGPTLETSYTTGEGTVEDTGHSIQVNTTAGTITYDGTTYDLLQFHAHTPSEHTVDGQHYAGELHLVHRASDDQLAVLGVFVEESSDAHPAFDGWTHSTDTTLSANPAELLPDERSYYTYEGSLTTPPCSEIVRWIVFDTPIQASTEQLDTLRAHHDDNARPTQPLGDRSLVFVER